MVEIELHEVQATKLVITACYTVTDGDTVSDVCNGQISRSELVEFIKNEDLNVVRNEISHGAKFTIDYKFINPETHLTENLDQVVTQFLMKGFAE